MLARVPAALLPVYLPVNVPGKAKEDGATTTALATHAGDKDGVPVSWFLPGVAPAIVAIWGVHLWMEDVPLSHLLSLLL